MLALTISEASRSLFKTLRLSLLVSVTTITSSLLTMVPHQETVNANKPTTLKPAKTLSLLKEEMPTCLSSFATLNSDLRSARKPFMLAAVKSRTNGAFNLKTELATEISSLRKKLSRNILTFCSARTMTLQLNLIVSARLMPFFVLNLIDALVLVVCKTKTRMS